MAAEMNRNKADANPAFSDKQGQYLAFIHAYTIVLGRSPAEADLQRHFRVTPPSVHQMILMLQQLGFIQRTPGAPRSIRILIDPDTLPTLHAAQAQTVKSPVQSH